MTTTFAPISVKLAYAHVFEAIQSAILIGELEEGNPLPTEAELCAQFGVKRSTVREGIRLLEQAGLVRRVNAKRLLVARPAVDEAAERTNLGLERHGVTFSEVLEAISAIQPVTARLAARHASAEDIAKLNSITKRLAASHGAGETVELGIGYLFAVGKASRNSVMEVVLRSLNLFAQTMLKQVIDQLPDAHDRIVRAQENITRAIKLGDEGRAESWMARHVEDLRRGYQLAGVDLDSSMSVLARAGN